MHIILAVALLILGAQQISPNTAPPGTPKGNASKRNRQQKAEQGNSGTTSESTCHQCLPCCSTEQSQNKTKEEQAKLDSLDLLTHRYMWATIVGVIGAWIGLAALIGQTIISRNSSHRQLRAYVVGEIGNIVNIANPILAFGGQIIEPTGAEISNLACGPVARIQIKNAGQTPAFEVKHWGNICFREYPLTAELSSMPAGLRPMPSVLGPGISSTKLFVFPTPLSAQQISDLRAGTGAVYVYGEVTYRDAFDATHVTKYRLMHHPIGGAIGVSTDLSFADEGNEAT